MASSQVKFYRGDLSVYQAAPGAYVDGVFFDTTYHEIYVNGTKYSERRWSYLNDASVIVSGGVVMLGIDVDDYLGSTPKYVRLSQVVGKNAISTTIDSSTGDVSVALLINNTGNTKTWLTQSTSGLKFDESVLESFKINGKGILSNSWLTAGDISVGSTPSVTDNALAINSTDSVALALQKVRRQSELKEIPSIKQIYVEDSSGNVDASMNISTSLVEKIVFKQGSYINIEHPSGDNDNRLVFSTTLHAGTNITIGSDGAINGEYGTYWNEID